MQPEALESLPNSNRISHDYVICLSITAAFTLLSTICVLLRFLQQKRNWGIWWDDWACLGALLFCYAFLVSTVLFSTIGHAGYHIWTYTPPQLEMFFKIHITLEIFYSISVAMSKYSILLLFSRLFSVLPRFKIYLYILFFLVTGYWISFLFGNVFAYNPVSSQWEFWLPHTNIRTKQFFVSTGIINSALDVAVLAFPHTQIWKLQMAKRKKILISLVFLLGGFVCITSILRVFYLATYDEADVTYELMRAFIWTVLEATISLVCSCLPIIYKLFGRNKSSHSSNKHNDLEIANVGAPSPRNPEGHEQTLEGSSATLTIESHVGTKFNPYHLGHEENWVEVELPNRVHVSRDPGGPQTNRTRRHSVRLEV